jgi:hypothetical protein
MLLKMREIFKPRTAPRVTEPAPRSNPKFPDVLDLSKRAKVESICGVASDSGHVYGRASASRVYVVRIVRKHGLGASFLSLARNELCRADSRDEARRFMRMVFPRRCDNGRRGWDIGFVKECKS